MGLGTGHRGQTAANVDSFQQTLLTSVMLAAIEKKKLVARQVFMDHSALYDGKSNVYTFPKGASKTATAYTEGTEVSYQDGSDSEATITLNKDYESSDFYSEFGKKKRSPMLMKSDVIERGYAIEAQIDTDILALYSSLTLVTEAATTDTGDNLYTHIVDAVGKLDTADIPQDDRLLLIHPVMKARFLNVDKFVSLDYIKGQYPVQTGLLGELFGVPVYMSSNVPTTSASSVTTYHNILAHKSAFGFVMSIKPQVYGPIPVGNYIGDSVSVIAQYGVGCINPGRGLTLTCTSA